MNLGGWLRRTLEDGNRTITHIIPLGDIRPHEFSPECWCEPIEIEDTVWSHNSADHREDFETGKRKVS